MFLDPTAASNTPHRVFLSACSVQFLALLQQAYWCTGAVGLCLIIEACCVYGMHQLITGFWFISRILTVVRDSIVCNLFLYFKCKGFNILTVGVLYPWRVEVWVIILTFVHNFHLRLLEHQTLFPLVIYFECRTSMFGCVRLHSLQIQICFCLLTCILI